MWIAYRRRVKTWNSGDWERKSSRRSSLSLCLLIFHKKVGLFFIKITVYVIFFVLPQVQACLPFSFLHSNMILIISTKLVYSGCRRCPWCLSNFDIFGCVQGPFHRRHRTIGTSQNPLIKCRSGVALTHVQ